ncbi:MAG: 16S rRNA (cytosine(1402)-N(4))-methyltransferase RsmH [Gammaproteobacteria bacterium]|nr:MAG: 16S rRNA (cytosine(1402)-N(4))-methyltransferase RsmH [Gammaproteobacteria bacterium]
MPEGVIEQTDAHQPVMLQEAMEWLAVQPEGIYLDATFGRGGHAEAILERLGPHGRLLALDKDPQAVAAAERKFATERRFEVMRGSFAMLGAYVEQRGWRGKVSGVLFDLGVSSPQLEDAKRGFSFLRDGPLDMRMDPDSGVSAASFLAKAKENEIADVLYQYGEERYARRIARAIVHARKQAPITHTLQLAGIVSRAHPRWERGQHPATKSFQALRIFINQELSELESGLTQCLDVLAPRGRLAVISFHSLEDRIVKRFIRDQARARALKSLGKARRPARAEIIANPRARSAVLRGAERLRQPGTAQCRGRQDAGSDP